MAKKVSNSKPRVRIMPKFIIDAARHLGKHYGSEEGYQEMLAGYEQLKTALEDILALPDHPMRKSAKEIARWALNQPESQPESK